MIIFKISLNLTGENLLPNNILNVLADKCCIEKMHTKGEKILYLKTERYYQSGYLSILNPHKYGKQGDGLDYEEWFVNFLEKNYEIFMKNDVEDINLCIDVYTEKNDDQCNFEIFNKEMLKRLCKFNVSLPISIYQLEEEEFNNLLIEIK